MASSPSSVLSPPRPKGLEEPRVFTPPLRRLTPKTTLGFALIEFADEVLGTPLLPWQKWLAVHALELLPDGTFRFRTVLLLVARQNGKSTFLQILALFFLYVRGVRLVIGTAQNLDIAEEVWQGAVDIAENVPELAEEIENVCKVNGKKALELRRGERYKVAAASRRGGRGLSGDLVLLDELREHQKWDAWSAVTKTTMARPLAQVWAASNAGDGSSIVLAHLRKLAHLAVGDPDNLSDKATEGDEDVDDGSLGIFEWSAAPGCPVSEGWGQANPSLGYAVEERAIRSAMFTDPDPVFRTEVLCQWVDGYHELVIPADKWLDCQSTDPAGEPQVFAVDVAPEQASASIAGGGFLGDRPIATVFESWPGTAWVVPKLLELKREHPNARFVAATGSPTGSIFTDAKNANVDIEPVTPAAHAAACAGLLSKVLEGRMRHRPDPVLDAALAGAIKKDMGDGAWLWSRKNSLVDISPLVAFTLALDAVTAEYDVLSSVL